MSASLVPPSAPAGPGEFDCLVLSGGGAKGAYGAGVAKGLHELRKLRNATSTVCYVGTSAGALNASVAATAGADALVSFWNEINTNDILGTFFPPMPKLRAAGKALRGFISSAPYAVYDSKSLASRIAKKIRFDPEQRADVHLIVAATNYTLGELRAFYTSNIADQMVRHDATLATGKRRLQHWVRVRDKAHLERVLLASAAIPLAFPPVEIDRELYVDGGVGNNTPTREAAYFLRYLNEPLKGKIGRVFLVTQDAPGTIVNKNDPLDALHLAMRSFDVFNAVHVGPIIKAWSRINTEVEGFDRALDAAEAAVRQSTLSGADQDALVGEIRKCFAGLTGAAPRLNVPIHHIRPSSALAETLDFSPQRIRENIRRGYIDFVRTIHSAGLITEPEEDLLTTRAPL